LEGDVCVRAQQIDRRNPEAAPERPALREPPGQSQTRLEVVQIPAGQGPLGVRDRAFESSERVRSVRVELSLLPELGLERALIAPREAEGEGKIFGRFEEVAEIDAVLPPLRQPGGAVLRELRVADRAQQESGESVAAPGDAGPEREAGRAGEVIDAGGGVLS